MREFSKNVSLAEIRLHCLDLAVNSARLLGRADGVEAVADTYFAWVTRKPEPPVQPQNADDAGAVGTDPQRPSTPQPDGGANTPPSLRGNGNKD